MGHFHPFSMAMLVITRGWLFLRRPRPWRYEAAMALDDVESMIPCAPLPNTVVDHIDRLRQEDIVVVLLVVVLRLSPHAILGANDLIQSFEKTSGWESHKKTTALLMLMMKFPSRVSINSLRFFIGLSEIGCPNNPLVIESPVSLSNCCFEGATHHIQTPKIHVGSTVYPPIKSPLELSFLIKHTVPVIPSTYVNIC